MTIFGSRIRIRNAARTKTDALMCEIEPSKEAMCLMESLESRLERPRSTDSLSATKHFLQSLKTPNDELRYKNAFDHNDIYRKLPPAEKDFVYQRAVLQKESLETRLIDKESGRQTPASTTVRKSAAMDFSAFRDELKTRFAEFVTKNPKLDDHELSEGVT